MPRQQLKLLNLTLNRPLEEKVPKANSYAVTHRLLEAACSVFTPLGCSVCKAPTWCRGPNGSANILPPGIVIQSGQD